MYMMQYILTFKVLPNSALDMCVFYQLHQNTCWNTVFLWGTMWNGFCWVSFLALGDEQAQKRMEKSHLIFPYVSFLNTVWALIVSVEIPVRAKICISSFDKMFADTKKKIKKKLSKPLLIHKWRSNSKAGFGCALKLELYAWMNVHIIYSYILLVL